MSRTQKNSFQMKMGKFCQAIAIRLHKVIRLGGENSFHVIGSKASEFFLLTKLLLYGDLAVRL